MPLKRVFLPNCVFLPNMSVKVRFALVFCVLLLVLVDCCQASGGQDGDEGFLEYLLLMFASLLLALPSLLLPLYSKQL